MLRVHFLNVGHGDCTIIEHPSGRLTMIDVNNCQEYDEDTEKALIREELARVPRGGLLASLGTYEKARYLVEARAKQELTDPIVFMKRTYPNRQLFRFILTHPDLDHMRGLRRLKEEIGFANFWDTSNQKTVESFRSDSDKIDWCFYQQIRANGSKTYTRGASQFAFGKEADGQPGGDRIEVLSPTPEIVRACNTNDKFNDISLVMRLHHAGRSVLLPGDAEDLAWDSMVEHYGTRLKSDFLKASHHGRDSGYNLKAVQHISPLMTFVSVGQKPSTDASHKYRAQSQRVASTRYYGDIELRIHDDGDCQWIVQRNGGT